MIGMRASVSKCFCSRSIWSANGAGSDDAAPRTNMTRARHFHAIARPSLSHMPHTNTSAMRKRPNRITTSTSQSGAGCTTSAPAAVTAFLCRQQCLHLRICVPTFQRVPKTWQADSNKNPHHRHGEKELYQGKSRVVSNICHNVLWRKS